MPRRRTAAITAHELIKSLALTFDTFTNTKKAILVTEAAKSSLKEIDLATAKVIRADNIA